MEGQNQILIEVQKVTKSFRSGNETLTVLKGIDLQIRSGEMMSICGASGVGKSTLLHILGTLEQPSSGHVLYNGADVFSLDDNRMADFRNRVVGFVFQFHHLLPEFSALENVVMPLLIAGESRGKAAQVGMELLSDVGLADRSGHKPGEMAGGEQQRVAIARALCMNPRIVFADEPTGNLDTRNGEAVHQLLRDLNRSKKITFVIVTHNEHLAQKSDRILDMLDGQISQRDGHASGDGESSSIPAATPSSNP